MRVFDAFCFSLMGMAAAFLLAGQANAGHNPPPLADPIPGAIPQGPVTVVLEDVATGLAFPTDVEEAPDGSGRLFVTLRDGRVVIIKDGSVLAQPFPRWSPTMARKRPSGLRSNQE